MESKGAVVTSFIEDNLTLSGSYLNDPFKLMDWQREIVDDIYSLDDAGRRKYRTYLLGMPRKSGKSQLGAALALYALCIDPADAAPLVISAAGDREQAKLVFAEAKRMVLASPWLSQICEVFRDTIFCRRTQGTYKAVSSDAGLAHGMNPSFVIVDEYHIHKNDELFVALQTGSAMRNQPMMLVITTAGFNMESPLGLMYQKGRRVESGEDTDPSFGFKWFGPQESEEFDHSDPAVWERFNPAWDIMRPEEFAATHASMHEAQFIRYRLNGWTSAENAWLPHGKWDELGTGETLTKGDEVIIGFDGAHSGDSTALVAVRISDLHLELIAVWESPANESHWRTPIVEVKQAILDTCEKFMVREILADPYRFEQTLADLAEDEGLPVVEYPTNSLARMIPATKIFYDAVLDATMTHSGNPIMARHLENCVLKEDAKGARITKEYRSSRKFIDAAVAGVIALQRAIAYRDQEPEDPRIITI